VTAPIARAETVGSLLRPPELLEARAGTAGGDRLRELEDQAVLAAIRLQESAGLDVITDGEMRRGGWAVTNEALHGFELRPGGPGLKWTDEEGGSGPGIYASNTYPTVVDRIRPRRDLGSDYAFLREHARARTKYSLPAPSYHRRFWYAEHSAGAYPTCEEFLTDVRDFQRTVIDRLIDLGCDYIQLDAPNYGTLCDTDNRRLMEARGHDLDAELAFDIELDNSLFEGIAGITRALHVCRGNAAGKWHSSGGYGTIAEPLFSGLDVDVLLLVYDSDRSRGFEPLSHVRPGTVAVLGLLTTKTGRLEDESVVAARVREAARVKPLDELAVSPQCGFASVSIGNPVTPDEQRAKLELVGRVARAVWA